MKRPNRWLGWGLAVSLTLVLSSCGGGGSGRGTAAAPTSAPGQPTATTTPVRATSSRNERTEASDAGSITLRVQSIDILGGQTTQFSVFLADRNGHPVSGERIIIDTGLGLELLSPQGGIGQTRGDGTLSGSIRGVSGGTFPVTATVDHDGSPLDGLSVILTVIVTAPRLSTATPTGGGPTPTPTARSCTDVQTIIVQTNIFNVSSQAGGTPEITAVVFDSNNLPVSGINVLFDVQPRIGSFDPLVNITGADDDRPGQTTTHLTIPPSSSFGALSVSASACGISGSVPINVVSGVSTKPVSSVVLQANPSTVGSLSGGTINLTAAVFDSDNKPIDGIDVLFISAVGKVNPLVDRTRVAGSEGGIATSVLQIPIDAVVRDYQVTALAGGITGSTIITIVPGRVGPGTINPGVPPGEPAAITLGASPTRIQVGGTGGTELATVIGRVFDNNGNPLSGVRVHYKVVAAQSAPGAVILPVTSPTASETPTPIPSTECSASDPVATSDTAGFAVIQVRAGPQPGPVTVAACADTTVDGVASPLIEQQAVVVITSGPVSRIGLAINSRAIDNNDGSLLTIATAVVTDAQGNTVEDGTPVFFEIVTRHVCDGGTNDGQPCTSSTTCGGGNCVEDESDPSRNVAISSNSTTNTDPPCDVSQFPVQTGFPVVPQPGDAITCVKYPSLQQGSEVIVRASVGGVVSNLSGQPLTLPGSVADLEVTVAPSTVTVTDTDDGLAVIRASVLNDLLDGVENVRVRFTTTIGTIDRSVLSDANGEAVATLVIPAGTPSGSATLRVAGGGLLISNLSIPIENTEGGVPTPGTGDQPAAIRFAGAQPAVIGVRGSGLPEQSTLTFQVTDALGMPSVNVPVTFSLARVADETISPTQAVTDENGNAEVTLTSGERALSVQITAQVITSGATLVTRSTAVSILGGPPAQPNFSLAHRFANISGRVTFGLQDEVTAFVADRFGNPVPPGTAVNFTTKGGAIGNPTTTNSLGQATATLVSQAPVTNDGMVATLATTRGERPFIDANGNGVCDEQDTLLPVPEPFYDSNCNRAYDVGEDFIDLNENGSFDVNQGPESPACSDEITVFDTICTTFSGPTSVLLLADGPTTVEAGGSVDFTLIISDNPDPIGNPGAGNPLVGGSTVNISTQGSRGRVLGLSDFTIPDTQTNNRIIGGVNRFAFSVADDAPDSAMNDTVVVVVSVNSAPGSLAAGGNGSATVQSAITFLSAPTPTSTSTPPATVTATPTPTSSPPTLAPTQTSLAAGSGAPPNACNGATQTFVVTGGSPPFSVFAGGGCVSIGSVPASGGSFVFTAGNTLGDFTITVTDAIGRTAAAGVRVLGPPTPTTTETPLPTLTPTVTPTVPPTETPTITPTATATPPPGSVQFIDAAPSTIGVRGSGLAEQSVLTFRINNTIGGPIPGVAVDFTLTGTGSESLNPLAAVSDADGTVTTTVTSGIQAATVRVVASIASNPAISGQSTAVSILGAPPAMNQFSLAPARLNVQGRVTLGLQDTISAFVNDRFGNAVPPGTAVSFVTNAASIVNPTTTDSSGVASGTLLTESLVTQGGVQPTGIVTVLAFTRGEESFLDNNGNGIFDAGDEVLTDDLPEPFIDFRPRPPGDNAACPIQVPPSSPTSLCNGAFDAGKPFERFVDVNGNLAWDAQGTSGTWDSNVFIFATTVVTFSGPLVTPQLVGCSTPPCSPFTIPNGGAIAFTINVHDDLLNPLVGGSSIGVSSSAGTVSGGNITIPDGESFNQIVPGLTQFSFVLSDADPTMVTAPPAPANVVVTINSPNGSGTFIIASGTVE